MEAETNLESSYRPPKFTLASTRKYMMMTWRRLASSCPSWPKDKQKPGLINLLKKPGPNLDLGTYEDFQKTLKATFSAYDSPDDALNEIKNLRMKYDDDIDKGKIEWKDQKFNFQKWFRQPKLKPKTTMEELPDKEELKNRTLYLTNKDLNAVLLELIEEGIQINKVTIATKLAAKENWKKEEKTDKELAPQEYHEYLDIFSKEKAARFPESRSWDHKIKMKEGFEPKSLKNYNLILAEQLELDKFLKENLEKGYIQPSQSPMASPFSFVSKKDGKLQPCQDYHYLNNWIIKNSYPLPLFSDILTIFAYIKEMNGRLPSKPSVMFFGMCNSPATWWMTSLLEWLMENW